MFVEPTGNKCAQRHRCWTCICSFDKSVYTGYLSDSMPEVGQDRVPCSRISYTRKYSMPKKILITLCLSSIHTSMKE